jgi:hypothetical protein
MSDAVLTHTAPATEARKLVAIVTGYWAGLCEEFRVSEEATDWANLTPIRAAVKPPAHPKAFDVQRDEHE